MPKNAWSDTANWQKIDLLQLVPTPCNRRVIDGVYSDCLEVLVIGRNRTTRFILTTSFFGTTINKMKQGFCQMFAELDKSSPLQKIQTFLSCAKSNLRMQHCFFQDVSLAGRL